MNSSNDLSSQISHFTEAQRPESTQELIDQLGLDSVQLEEKTSKLISNFLGRLSAERMKDITTNIYTTLEDVWEDEDDHGTNNIDTDKMVEIELYDALKNNILEYIDSLEKRIDASLEQKKVEDVEVCAYTSSAVRNEEISSSRSSAPFTQMSNDDDRMTPPIFITPSPLKRSASQAFPSEYTYSGPRHRDTHFLVLGMPHPRGCYKVLIEGDVPGHSRFTRACMLPGRYPHPLEGLDEESGTFETQPLITAEERAEFPEVYPNPYPEPEVVDLTDSAPDFPISCAGQTVDLSEEDRPTATQEAREVMEESIAATCEVDDEYLETGDTVF